MAKLSKTISQNKKTLVLIFGLVVFLFFAFGNVKIAQADEVEVEIPGCSWANPIACFTGLVSYVLTLPIRSAALLIAIPLAIIALVTWALYAIVVALMGWLKIIALSVPVIPSDVGAVQAGWEVTRNLANMGFILILVFIGLATILRIKEYEAKKLLPTLIIVALLINFSPVIVGFVVDISNIVSNFFLNMGSWENIGESFLMVLEYFGRVFTILTTFDNVWAIIGHVVGIIILGIVLILFFGYSAWIYLLVAALLVARIIALWVLMILAPLAFLFYVLPAGRKLAREWWQQLIQWSIIAIPIGFFLFLSFEVIKATTQIQGFFHADTLKGNVEGVELGGEIDFGNLTGELADALGIMLVPLISIVMLHIGYKLSRRYMPEAANQIIGGIEKGFKMAAGVALVAATGGAAAGLAVKGLAGAARAAQRMEAFMGKAPIVGKPLKALVGKPMIWATRGTEMAASPWLKKQEAKLQKINVDKEMKERGIENDIQGQIDYANRPGLTDRNRLQVYSWMADKGTLQKTSDEEKDKAASLAERFAKDPHFKKEAGDVADVLTNRISAKTEIELEATPDLQKEMEDEIEEEAKKLSQEIEMKPVIDEEAERLVKAKLFKTKDEAQGFASKNVAARYIHFTGLKSGDMKDQATDSITSKIAARSLRDTTPGHLQAVVSNFKAKTSNKVLDETFNGMFRNPETKEYYSDKENKEILKQYYLSDPRHARMIQWSMTTPAGREMNPTWKKYMPKGKKGRPDFGTFEVEMENEKEKRKKAEEEMEMSPELELARKMAEERRKEEEIVGEAPATPKKPPILKKPLFYSDKKRRYEELRDKLKRGEGLRTAEEQRKFNSLEKEVRPVLDEIERLKNESEDIKKTAISGLQRYRQLKRNPLRSAEEQSEFKRLLPELRRKVRRIKEISGAIEEPKLEIWAEEELAQKISKEREAPSSISLGEWPKEQKGMPRIIRNKIKEGKKYITGISKKEKGFEILNKEINKLEQRLTSLKAKAAKSPEEEGLISEIEMRLIPARRVEVEETQESLNGLNTRLNEIYKEIDTWTGQEISRKEDVEGKRKIKEEAEKSRRAEREGGKQIKEEYKNVRKRIRKIKKEK